HVVTFVNIVINLLYIFISGIMNCIKFVSKKEKKFMKLMEGKKGLIFGVSNTHGIAYAIARQLFEAGADIAFTYAGEAMEKRVRPLAEEMNAKIIMSCDVTKEDEIKAVVAECERVYGK